MLHAARKLKPKQLDVLDTVLSEVDYTCGTELADFVPDVSLSEAEHILKTMFVRKDLECRLPKKWHTIHLEFFQQYVAIVHLQRDY